MYAIGTTGVICTDESKLHKGTPVEIRGTTGDNNDREYYILNLENRSHCWIREEDFKPQETIQMAWHKVIEAVKRLKGLSL